MEPVKRKGARTTKEIPKSTLKRLNQGELESANVVEWFAIDRRLLLKHVLVKHDREKYLQPILEMVDSLEKQTSNLISETIGAGLLQQTTLYNDKEFFKIISHYSSDLVRSWGTFMIGKNTDLTLKQMLEKIRPFAADAHFNVREEAWTAVRPRIIANLDESIYSLSEWSLSENDNLRRFASEVTRPRGVWCKHIEVLKEYPQRGLSILEPLKSDSSKYVRDSVANWLNDASKTQPDFVVQLCQCWGEESETKETQYIIKKALRTINKSKN
ncbi:DNA alkylation repair protein [Candidatus Enterococcus ferrettii]|uniref:DNA alkylation repair protein n=1 Tax=Candidatus Enterococcus ferrettii TaxID=2815324 RepID=A0ABV0EV02_9ENTE|nr:DNA alkylation repair protein [Enterococcus sp. 665A]MBO1341674.1 DNA alkylation repair protein [Enterococcus sp. 665A]